MLEEIWLPIKYGDGKKDVSNYCDCIFGNDCVDLLMGYVC